MHSWTTSSKYLEVNYYYKPSFLKLGFGNLKLDFYTICPQFTFIANHTHTHTITSYSYVITHPQVNTARHRAVVAATLLTVRIPRNPGGIGAEARAGTASKTPYRNPGTIRWCPRAIPSPASCVVLSQCPRRAHRSSTRGHWRRRRPQSGRVSARTKRYAPKQLPQYGVSSGETAINSRRFFFRYASPAE